MKIEAFILIFYIISRFGTISDRARGLLEGYQTRRTKTAVRLLKELPDKERVKGCWTVKGAAKNEA